MNLFEVITLVICYMALGLFKSSKSIIPSYRHPLIYNNLLFIIWSFINGFLFTFIILFMNFKWYLALFFWFLSLLFINEYICPKVVLLGEKISSKIEIWGKKVLVNDLSFFGIKINGRNARFIKIFINLLPIFLNPLATLLFFLYYFGK